MDLVIKEETKIQDLREEVNEIVDSAPNFHHFEKESLCSSLNESLKNEIETEVEICPDISAVFVDCDDNEFCGFNEDVETDELQQNNINEDYAGSSYEIASEDVGAKWSSSQKLKLNSVDCVPTQRISSTFQCYHCKRSFTTELKIRNHLKMNVENCAICSQQFSYKCLFNLHLKTHHVEKRICLACNAEFSYTVRVPNLVADLNRCEKCVAKLGKLLPCKFCAAAFSEHSLLQDHERTHDPEKPYQCDICGQRFSLMQHIKRHIEVLHNGGVRYQCKLCSKCFRWDSCLRTHLKTHTNERPHKCSFCDYSFRRPCDLRRHMITHTNEKRFSCTQCDKLFTRNSSMQRHLRTHFGEKPYLCNVCGKRFNESFFLKEHMESHSENRSYFYCDWCNKRFNNRRVLRMHAKKHEKDQVLKMDAEN